MKPLYAVTFVLTALWVSEARADKTATQVLALMDNSVTNDTDESFVFDLAIKEKGKPEKRLGFEVVTKGPDWRRIDFIYPGDLKGMRILVRSVSQMYVYLPAFKKVRRVASHVKEQGFMGSAYDHDEISLAQFGRVFDPESVEDKGKYWRLILRRKKDADFPYAKLEVDVRKDVKQPAEIRYFDEKGLKLKTEKRFKYKCEGDNCTPSFMQMTDHTRNDLESTLTLKDWKIGKGTPDSFFTVRALQRGG